MKMQAYPSRQSIQVHRTELGGIRREGSISEQRGHERCWNHHSLNLAARHPTTMQSSLRRRLRDLSHAPTRAECEGIRDEYVSELRADGRTDAAETVLRVRGDFVSF